MKIYWVRLLLLLSLIFPVPGFSLEPPKRVKELGRNLGHEKKREVRRSKKVLCQYQRGKAPCSTDVGEDQSSKEKQSGSDDDVKGDSETPN